MKGRLAAALLLAACHAAAAQSPDEIRLEAGAGEVRQAGNAARHAVLLGTVFRRTRDGVTTTASGSATLARDSIATAQGLVAVRFPVQRGSRWKIESGVAGAIFGLRGLTGGGNYASFARVQRESGDHGLWAGAGGGTTNRGGFNYRASAYDAGGWAEYKRTSGTAAVVWTRSYDTDLLAASSPNNNRPFGAYTVRDATVTLQQSFSMVDFAAIATMRAGEGVSRKVNDRALMVAGAFYLTPVVALTVSGGRQLADPLRALPDAHFLAASIRVLALRQDPAVRQIDANGAIAFTRPDPQEGTLLMIRVNAPPNARVEVSGSFTGWQPLALHWVQDAWELQLPVPSGPQRVAVRINGGPWRTPANLTKVTDEFGGEAGLVVVP